MAPTDSSMLEARIECCYEVVNGTVQEKPPPKTLQQRPQSLIRRMCSLMFGCKPEMDIIKWREGYVKLVAWFWVLLLGPLCGWMGCAYLIANKTQVTDILYLMLFLSFYIFGLLSTAFNKKRWVSRIWLVIGMVIIFTMWAKYTTRIYNDDFERRLTMYWVMTIFYLVTIFLPLVFTDTFLLSILC